MAKASRNEAWEHFGEALKERREDAGPTPGEPPVPLFVSGAQSDCSSREFEQEIRKPQLDMAKRIDATPQTGASFERPVCQLVNKKPRFGDLARRSGGGEARTARLRSAGGRPYCGLVGGGLHGAGLLAARTLKG
ncbi:hypothetical protein ACWGK1_17160 [Streptomyces wedmorensis]